MPSKVNTNSGVFIAAAVGFFAIGALLTAFAPPFLDKSWAKPIAGLKNYAEAAKAGDVEAQKIVDGRKIYIREGCWYCHTQQARTIEADTVRYGWRGVKSPVSTPDEFVYDTPFQWGSKRTGPDLHRVGGKYPHLWHVRHMDDPRSTTPGSIMPRFPHLLTDTLDMSLLQSKMKALTLVGVPYSDSELAHAEEISDAQAAKIAAELEAGSGPKGLKDKEIIALTAYLQRLGTDIKWRKPEQPPLTLGAGQ